MNDLSQTPLSADEQAEHMMWQPLLTWLKDWDVNKAAGLNSAGVAVRQQRWGGTAAHPQTIEKAYLHSNEIWVKVVFESFVKLGVGLADTDGDGRSEIYAKVDPSLYSADLVEHLVQAYIKPTFNTHGLSAEVTESLNELYSTTAAQVEKYIGQPFTVPNLGTINYPFVVLRHSSGAENVLLVSP